MDYRYPPVDRWYLSRGIFNNDAERGKIDENGCKILRMAVGLPAAWAQRIFTYTQRNRSGETNASESLAIGKERIELLRYYGIVE